MALKKDFEKNGKLLNPQCLVYGSDKLPRLTYSITPQFGNRGSSRSDVKTLPCRLQGPRGACDPGGISQPPRVSSASGAEHKLLEATT